MLNAIILFGIAPTINAQSLGLSSTTASSYYRVHPRLYSNSNVVGDDSAAYDPNGSLPNPKQVMFKSLMIPGWGQVINHQIWKVPLVYGLLGGLVYYSIKTTKDYHDYRAAYYNLNSDLPDDNKFGPTPPYISKDANLRQIRTMRNKFLNRRNLIYIGVALAYGLNILDAFIIAHMRSFDVSDDLSMRTSIKPGMMAEAKPGITISIDLITK